MRPTLVVSILSLCVASTACQLPDDPVGELDEASTSADAEPGPELGDDDLAALDDQAADAVEIATFHMSNGNLASLYSVPGEDELLFSESSVVEENLVFADAEDVSMLEKFLILAPDESIPIPRALAATDDAGLVSPTRAVVDVVDEPIEVDVFGQGLLPQVSQLNVSTACSDSDYFQSEVCYCPGCALITAFWFCDEDYNGGNSLWFSLTRSTEAPSWGSPERKSDSWSKTVACSTPVRTRHYRKALVGNNWSLSIDETRPAGWYTIWHAEGSDRHRRVQHERTTSSGGLRAHTYFY